MKMLVPGATRPRNEGDGGVDAGVDHGDGAILAVVGNAQRAQVVQADQGAARRVGQVGRGLELPDPLRRRRRRASSRPPRS